MVITTNALTDKSTYTDTIAAGDAEFLDGDGNSTSTYNNSGASSTNDVTFLQLPLREVADVSATVEVDDTDAATGTIVAQVEPASEAVADDLDGVADGIENSLVVLTLRDTSDGSELASDTDVSDLELNVTAINQ